jgi:hypothetical protein
MTLSSSNNGTSGINGLILQMNFKVLKDLACHWMLSASLATDDAMSLVLCFEGEQKTKQVFQSQAQGSNDSTTVGRNVIEYRIKESYIATN